MASDTAKEHTLQKRTSIGARTERQILDGVCHGLLDPRCKWPRVDIHSYHHQRSRVLWAQLATPRHAGGFRHWHD